MQRMHPSSSSVLTRGIPDSKHMHIEPDRRNVLFTYNTLTSKMGFQIVLNLNG
jgi:hypothetical protein